MASAHQRPRSGPAGASLTLSAANARNGKVSSRAGTIGSSRLGLAAFRRTQRLASAPTNVKGVSLPPWMRAATFTPNKEHKCVPNA